MTTTTLEPPSSAANDDDFVRRPPQKQHLHTTATALTPQSHEQHPTASSYHDNALPTSTTEVLYYPFSVSSHHNPKQQKRDVLRVAMALCPWLVTSRSSSGTSSMSCDGIPHGPKEEVSSDEAAAQQQQLTVRPLTGGLSNELFVVEKTTNRNQSGAAAAVLVRIHPTNDGDDDDIVDRNVENRLVAWLSLQSSCNNNNSNSKLAPAVYGRFANGRVEEFYRNVVPLRTRDMPAAAPVTGRLLGRLHRLRVPAGMFDAATACESESLLPGAIWQRGDDWLALAYQKLERRRSSSSSSQLVLLDQLQKEWDWVKEAFRRHYQEQQQQETFSSQACALGREVVLTHMDCQSLNLLKSSDDDNMTNIRVIDYEYAGLNPRAADLANTFCEFCNMNDIAAVWDEEYPAEAIQDQFLRAYLLEEESSSSSSSPHPDYLAALRHEIGRYTLLSHLTWAVWSLIQAANRRSSQQQPPKAENDNYNDAAADTNNDEPAVPEESSFDYEAYARHRMDGYRYFKRRFWGAEASKS